MTNQRKCPGYKLWFAEKKAARTCPRRCQGLGRLELSQYPEDKHLRRLTHRLAPSSCREIFITLGMPTSAWDKLCFQYQHADTDDLMFMAILKWKDKTHHATFEDLNDALEKCGTHKHLLCEVLRDVDPDISAYDDETLKKTPSSRSLVELSNHIGNTSIHLGIELGLKMTKIQEIQYQYKNKLLDQTKEILRIWRKQTTPKPTILLLIKALYRIEKSNCLQEVHLK